MSLESFLVDANGNSLSSSKYSRRQVLTAGVAMLGLFAMQKISSADNPPTQLNLPPPKVLSPGYQILQLFDQSCTLPSGDKSRDFYERLIGAGLDKKARLVTEGTLMHEGVLTPISYVEYCPSKYGFSMDPTNARIKLFRAPYENAARKEKNLPRIYTALRVDKTWENVLKNRLEVPRGDLVLRIIEKLVEYPYAWDHLVVDEIPDRVVSKDNWQPPRRTRIIKRGDCEDKAFLGTDDLVQEGFIARWVLGLREAGKRNSGHAWVELETPGTTSEWIIEATVPDIIRKNSKKIGAFEEVPLDLKGSLIAEFKRTLNPRELNNLFRHYRDKEYGARRSSAVAVNK